MRKLSGLYENCRLCPKACGTDRLHGQHGICGMPGGVVAASAVLHKGEEPPLIGEKGSGAVFFSGCTLGCPFCQNEQISIDSMGADITDNELAAVFLALEAEGASNINLVTATQFTPSVIAAVGEARAKGLQIPIMWNSSGYETNRTVKLLSETIDIWLPDIKTLDPMVSERLFGARDYPAAARASIKMMASQLEKRGGELIEDNVMKRGMIVRHLVMPGELDSSRAVLEWYAENLIDRAMLSLMVQYTPVNESGRQIAGPDYIMQDNEYNQLLEWLDEFGIEEGFLQSPEAASKEWIPDFSRLNPFPEKYSKPVWHWKFK
ncbi:MAG: radical SAM protein [Spirochaetales bacterium]|uniref:Radical SAM protein n=1 Tax=Candidatus Thalassospirochaeta sargassi TaxID=3119039 RepID=A0AAJ1IEA8_9SPIO|nr:radical SAM protein [Spirochaetales bacterium]